MMILLKLYVVAFADSVSEAPPPAEQMWNAVCASTLYVLLIVEHVPRWTTLSWAEYASCVMPEKSANVIKRTGE